MEFEKLRQIVAGVLNMEAGEISMDTRFADDLGADSLDIFRLSWASRRRSISRYLPMRRRKSPPSGTP